MDKFAEDVAAAVRVKLARDLPASAVARHDDYQKQREFNANAVIMPELRQRDERHPSTDPAGNANQAALTAGGGPNLGSNSFLGGSSFLSPRNTLSPLGLASAGAGQNMNAMDTAEHASIHGLANGMSEPAIASNTAAIERMLGLQRTQPLGAPDALDTILQDNK